MSMTDPVADMLTRIRNAQSARKKSVIMVHSKLKHAIAKVLQEEGYIADVTEETLEGNKKSLTVELKYYNNKPVIEHIKRVSRPGLRSYVSKDKIPLVLNGLGIAILSTSNGVCSDKQARANGVGGELLCTVT